MAWDITGIRLFLLIPILIRCSDYFYFEWMQETKHKNFSNSKLEEQQSLQNQFKQASYNRASKRMSAVLSGWLKGAIGFAFNQWKVWKEVQRGARQGQNEVRNTEERAMRLNSERIQHEQAQRARYEERIRQLQAELAAAEEHLTASIGDTYPLTLLVAHCCLLLQPAGKNYR